MYDQTLPTSIYDRNSHIFKVALFASKCANYADVEALRKDPSLATECGSYLGPNQPGITMPDPTKFDDPRSDTAKRIANHRADPTPPKPPSAPALPLKPPACDPSLPVPSLPGGTPPVQAPSLPGVSSGASAPSTTQQQQQQTQLLDYLLKP